MLWGPVRQNHCSENLRWHTSCIWIVFKQYKSLEERFFCVKEPKTTQLATSAFKVQKYLWNKNHWIKAKATQENIKCFRDPFVQNARGGKGKAAAVRKRTKCRFYRVNSWEKKPLNLFLIFCGFFWQHILNSIEKLHQNKILLCRTHSWSFYTDTHSENTEKKVSLLQLLASW